VLRNYTQHLIDSLQPAPDRDALIERGTSFIAKCV
jgi:hypothetical protein